MGYLKERADRNGQVRYTACYLDARGSLRSAGTFSNQKDANMAWQKAETKLAEGRVNDPRRGRQTFRRYVTEEWLPHHVMEATTREANTYQIGKHILPWFGPMRMNQIVASHVREWVTDLRAKNVTPATIQKVRFILSAIFTTMLGDVTFLHPCKGVKTPTVPRKALKIITPEQFDAIYGALPGADEQLLIETDVETGLRWGGLTELRVNDLDAGTRIVTVSRTVVEIDPKFHPDGERFLIKPYPKDKEFRRVKLSQQLAGKITTHINAHQLGDDDLLFAIRPQEDSDPRLRVFPGPATLGFTEPNAACRRYRHGTLSGYNAGKCRCRFCKDACALYRADRRAAGKGQPRQPRTLDSDGHIPRDWFRLSVWKPALKKARIAFAVRAHHLRHAHASWLLAGGADLQDTALDAFAKIRSRTKEPA